MNTLRLIHALSGANAVVFDFALPREGLSLDNKLAFDLLAGRVASVGEPFIGFFGAAEIHQELERIGFSWVEALGSEEINRRYFHERADGLQVTGALANLLCARGE